MGRAVSGYRAKGIFKAHQVYAQRSFHGGIKTEGDAVLPGAHTQRNSCWTHTSVLKIGGGVALKTEHAVPVKDIVAGAVL